MTVERIAGGVREAMKIAESGRFIHPIGSESARKYAEESLLSVHGRFDRLRAIARGARLRSREGTLDKVDEGVRIASQHPAARRADWLLLRDYHGTKSRERSILFFFSDDDDSRPAHVIKVRRQDAAGQSLGREAGVLRAIAGVANAPALGIPIVEDYKVVKGYELLVVTGVGGRPLSLMMQRSLRPRTRHAQHLAAAGEWLGKLHASTRRGDEVSVHGDFWPRNILFTGEQLCGVVDWEHGAIAGAPWDDLFTLPILFATASPAWRERDREAAFLRGFVHDSPLKQAIGRYFAAYSRASGVPMPLLRDAFDIYLIDQEKKEAPGWQQRYRWPAMRSAISAAKRSVFSG